MSAWLWPYFALLAYIQLLVLPIEGRFQDGGKQNYFQSRHKNRISRKSEVLNLRMPGVIADQDDDYWCTSYDLDSISPNAYVTQFEAKADGSVAHHIILFACQGVSEANVAAKAWKCLGGNICEGESNIIFAWAKNAQPTSLPADVGFDVGSDVKKRHFVMQVHYAHKSADDLKDRSGLDLTIALSPPKYSAGIYLMFSGYAVIPPKTPVTHVDVNCLYDGQNPFNVFAYRVHAHSLGSVVTGYKFSHDLKHVEEIARGNPNWPQAFFPVKTPVTINPDDWVAARCTYNSTSRTTVTNIGSGSGDEMCNLYLMFYAERDAFPSSVNCAGDNVEGLAAHMPKDSDKPLKPNPLLEMVAHGHGGPLHAHGAAHGSQAAEEDTMTGKSVANIVDLGFEMVKNWPQEDLSIGQPNAVFYTSDGTIMVFHRGDRVWDGSTFDGSGEFRQKDKGPIATATVVEMNSDSGKVLRRWGSNLFYLPHGLYVDHLSNTWLTDVAMHQVFKFTQNDLKTPAMILGTAFKSGSDETHFCKPTSVTVSTKDGSIFVADGYCNSRIVKFDSQGKFIAQWGVISDTQGKPLPGTWVIPHSIVTVEDRGLVCAADRENSRLQCLDMNSGDVKSVFYMPERTGAYALTYSPENGGRLWAVTAVVNLFTGKWTGSVYVFDMNTQNIVGKFGSLERPHDLAVDSKGGNVYIVDLIQPYKVKRFYNANITVAENGTIQEPKEEALVFGKLPKSVQQLLNSGVWDTATPLLIASLLAAPVLAILSVTICIRLRKRRAVAQSQKGWWKASKGRSGFRKLRQEDTIALNSDDATSDSDNEDVLYTAAHALKKNNANAKAKC